MAIEIWRENGHGLLFPGWYAASDEGPRRGPFETKSEAEHAIDHAKDGDCTVVGGTCTTCGVSHDGRCRECGGSGFHVEGCSEVDE
jgi:hypothetical protein